MTIEISKDDFTLLFQTMTLKQIAKKMGCHVSTIAKKAQRMGLKKKRGRKEKLKII
jgi:uncharacterized protein YjcR